jgi:hypothetical protein
MSTDIERMTPWELRAEVERLREQVDLVLEEELIKRGKVIEERNKARAAIQRVRDLAPFRGDRLADLNAADQEFIDGYDAAMNDVLAALDGETNE